MPPTKHDTSARGSSRKRPSAVVSRKDVAKFHATKPTVGLKYEPFRTVTLRLSYATAFLPPTFGQLTQNLSPRILRFGVRLTF